MDHQQKRKRCPAWISPYDIPDNNELPVNKEDDILSAYWPAFLWWFAHLCSGLGRDPITLPSPAMVLMDRRDLNSKKKTIYGNVNDFEKKIISRNGGLCLVYLKYNQVMCN